MNAPLTSSLGRLFDAVAALVLARRGVDYEAQAAIELEGVAVDERDGLDCAEYIPELVEGESSSGSAMFVLRTKRLWHEVVHDLQQELSKAAIAARFHAGIAEGFIAAAKRASETTGIRQVALSGGCLHNRRLARLLRSGLEAHGLQVFAHRQVSPGDGGLSYGQAVVGAALLNKQSVSLKT